MRVVKRRDFLQAGVALALGGAFVTSRLAFARTGEGVSKSRFVLIVMRGALDGLAAVPPYGDPDYAGLRRELALKAPGSPGGALPLDGFFGLHPSLTFMRDSYSAKELVVFHSIASQFLGESSYIQHASQNPWPHRATARGAG